MYTIVPFRGQRAMTRNMAHSLFGDDFFRSFFDVSDMVGQAGFRGENRRLRQPSLFGTGFRQCRSIRNQ